MPVRSAAIVGGGIGGLAAAVALHRRGWRVVVHERSAEFGEVGAGISLWGNALRALDALGLGRAVRDRAAPELTGGIRDRRGRWLTRMDAAALARRHGPTVLVHRADLLQALVDATPSEALRPASPVTSPDDLDADLVVGADGVNSTVRRAAMPDARPPRYAGYTAWRFVTPPRPTLTEIGESWGRGQRFGYAQLPDGRVYWYATASLPAAAPIDDDVAELRRRFADWHEPVPDLIAAADGRPVLRHDIVDLPALPTYVAGRVALLGDAAHAMTPDLGQGACQALEDAVVLADAVDRADDLAAGLAAYDRARRPRTQAIAARARRVGAVGQLSSAVSVGIRNAVTRLVPTGVTERAVAAVLDWSPPPPPTGERAGGPTDPAGRGR